MSAAPLYPTRRVPQRGRTPSVAAQRAQSKRSRRAGVLWTIVAYALLFSGVVTVTFGFSTLVGHSMKENARREAIRAGERAKVARADVARVRARVERLTTMRAVDDWARLNGFVSSYQFVKKATVTKPTMHETLLAKRDAGLKIEIDAVRADGADTIR